MTLLVTTDMIGKTITFSSKNPTDATVYTGVVSGLCTEDYAQQIMGDINSYNTVVQRADSSVGDISTLNYFIFKLANGQSVPTVRIFADEWIAPGTLSVIQQATAYKLTVYDTPNLGQSALLALLRTNNYGVAVTG